MSSSLINTNLPKEKTENQNNKESEVAILSILEKSYYNNNIPEENFEIPSELLNQEDSKTESNNNITLFNALYNSLINKDHKSFLFCIQQNNEILIEETVKQMNSDCLGKFIEKSLDIFQSNSFYTKYIIPWMQKILKFKKINILTKNNIENLIKIQMYIKDKIKCFNNLCLLKQKMKKINEIFAPPQTGGDGEQFLKNKKNEEEKNILNNNNKPVIFEPLLTYYESEDEEEKKENKIKKDKMEIEGFEEIEKENNEEDEEMEDENEKEEESEEDYFDEEIDNMENDEKDKIKKINKEKIELDNEEEENEDDNEEDDD